MRLSVRVHAAMPAGRARRGRIAFFVPLLGAIALCDPAGLIAVPLQYLLRDGLGATPSRMALFEGALQLPAYVGFLFGAVRDRWQPAGGDRASLLASAALAALGYALLALWQGPTGYGALLGALLVAAIAMRFGAAVAEALVVGIAARERLSGYLSAVTEMAQLAATGIAFAAGGWLAAHVSPPVSFLAAAAACACLAAVSSFAPRAPVPGTSAAGRTAPAGNPRDSVWRSPGVVVAVLMLSAWNFSPGFATPLFYFLTGHVGLSPEQFGAYRSVYFVAMGLSPLLYMYLCARVPMGRLLGWAVGLNVGTGFLLLLIDGPGRALAVGVVVGSMIGFGNVALFDVARRVCPPRLAGTAIMLAFSGRELAGTAGDLCGAWLYERHGLLSCIVLDAFTSLAVLPLLRRLPANVAIESEAGTGTGKA